MSKIRVIFTCQSCERKLPTGVSRTTNGSYKARICAGGKKYVLGTFATEEEAAAAYQEAVAEKEAGTLQARLDNLRKQRDVMVL